MHLIIPPFANSAIEAVFNSYPPHIGKKLLFLRALIFTTASEIAEVGPLEETLRWNEPSYITTQSKSGSMIRIHHYPKKPFDYALYVHCGTNLIETFKHHFPNIFRYGGNRSIEFMVEDVVPIEELKKCIGLALTYKLDDHKSGCC